MLGQDDSQVKLMQLLAAGKDFDVYTGLAGIQKLLDLLPSFESREDLPNIASYASQCIEKFGTGGGNFRLMYAEFLSQAGQKVPDLVDVSMADLTAQSASKWTALSESFTQLAKPKSNQVNYQLDICRQRLSEIYTLETRLFESLGAKLGL